MINSYLCDGTRDPVEDILFHLWEFCNLLHISEIVWLLIVAGHMGHEGSKAEYVVQQTLHKRIEPISWLLSVKRECICAMLLLPRPLWRTTLWWPRNETILDIYSILIKALSIYGSNTISLYDQISKMSYVPGPVLEWRSYLVLAALACTRGMVGHISPCLC